MLIIGGGIIGLELGTVYSTLGARLDVVEMRDALMPGADTLSSLVIKMVGISLFFAYFDMTAIYK
jgi:dihydrolipoamide dehydrogenase